MQHHADVRAGRLLTACLAVGAGVEFTAGPTHTEPAQTHISATALSKADTKGKHTQIE